jgi:hypothetical protein
VRGWLHGELLVRWRADFSDPLTSAAAAHPMTTPTCRRPPQRPPSPASRRWSERGASAPSPTTLGRRRSPPRSAGHPRPRTGRTGFCATWPAGRVPTRCAGGDRRPQRPDRPVALFDDAATAAAVLARLTRSAYASGEADGGRASAVRPSGLAPRRSPRYSPARPVRGWRHRLQLARLHRAPRRPGRGEHRPAARRVRSALDALDQATPASPDPDQTARPDAAPAALAGLLVTLVAVRARPTPATTSPATRSQTAATASAGQRLTPPSA